MLSPETPPSGRERAEALEPRSHVPFLLQLQPEQLDCGAAHLQHPLSILQPLKATPVFRAPGLSSVAVASVSNYTVVFLGTASGRLLKVGLGGGSGRRGGREGSGSRRPRPSISLHVLRFASPFTAHKAFSHLFLPLPLTTASTLSCGGGSPRPGASPPSEAEGAVARALGSATLRLSDSGRHVSFLWASVPPSGKGWEPRPCRRL